jgi:VIT1/CCC1 family predicted Fe2+/Mn2+ transporter
MGPDVITDAARELHSRGDPHRPSSRLAELILGGQDGLVNVLGVLLGVAAATSDSRVVLAAGLAATFAESVSMGAVAFTSMHADRAAYRSELERERRHVRQVPAIETEEIREIYRSKGLSGELLEQVVRAITANPEVWVAVMMLEELHLQPRTPAAIARGALRVGLAALVGSLVPLVPFAFLPVGAAMWAAIGLATATLFAVGAYKAATTVGHWLRSGLELAAIGMASAFLGYFIGRLFHV